MCERVNLTKLAVLEDETEKQTQKRDFFGDISLPNCDQLIDYYFVCQLYHLVAFTASDILHLHVSMWGQTGSLPVSSSRTVFTITFLKVFTIIVLCESIAWQVINLSTLQ